MEAATRPEEEQAQAQATAEEEEIYVQAANEPVERLAVSFALSAARSRLAQPALGRCLVKLSKCISQDPARRVWRGARQQGLCAQG